MDLLKNTINQVMGISSNLKLVIEEDLKKEINNINNNDDKSFKELLLKKDLVIIGDLVEYRKRKNIRRILCISKRIDEIK